MGALVPTSFRFNVLALAISGVGLASSACAQTVSPPPSSPSPTPQPASTPSLELERVTVTGQHYDTAIGTSDAASQGIVEGAALQDIPLLRPGEILETVPGLVVTQHSGDGKANQYFLRGYNLDHGTDLATTVDAVPVNMPTNAHGQGYTDLNFVIPELVDNIAYQKGPYYAQYGDFASAGAVDIHYRDTVARDFANLTVGDDGYRRLVMAGSCYVPSAECPIPATPAGLVDPSGVRILGGLELLEENGPWVPKEELHKFNGLVRISDGTPANGWSIDGIGYAAHWNSTDQVPLALIESGALGRYSALDPTDGGDTGRMVASGEWHSIDDDGFTRASFYMEHYRLQLWSDFTYYELRPATGDQFEQQEYRNFFGGTLEKGWNTSLLGLSSTNEVGLQLRHDHIDVGLFDTEDRRVFATVSNEIVGETSVGLYAQNTTFWTPWFHSLLGVREDEIYLNANALSTPENSGNDSGSKLSPKMSLIFGPWCKTEFFVDAGAGFHSNDARGVIDKIDPTTGQAASPVPALVGSFGKELGLRTQVIPGLQSSLALWTLNSDSELVYNADSDIGSTSPNAASRRRGVEWNNHLVYGEHLLMDLDLAWTHARYAEENQNGAVGDQIPNAVGKVGIFRATLQNFGPWVAGIETRFIGPYPLSQDGALTAPSAVVTNIRIQRELTRNVTLILDALNIFDRQYYDIAYEQDYRVTPTSPIVPNGVTVHPGEPREFRVTLSVKI
jgi:outer membrane receptor protein involved in Fe transport